MQNKKMIESIEICSERGNLFDVECPYEIPLYQRPYAWGEDQIRDLIEDISDVPENDEFKYCLGSLIVSKNRESYEVIDGQQRLTTLFLLLNFLKINTKKNLSFACREKSTKTLHEINIILEDFQKLYDDGMYQAEILSGLRLIKRFLPEESDCLVFKKKLKKVFLYRIIVPDHTNLNHYFEIMNTRGEQLEQTDVLKGRLMAFLSKDEKRQSIFAKIWDACSDMTGYVQMHFLPEERGKLFGDAWDDTPSHSYERGGYLSLNTLENSSCGFSVKDIIRDDFEIDDVDGFLEDGQRVKFESVIEFKHFLLHVLKVYIRVYLNCDDDAIVPKAIDEKRLIKNFEEVEKKCLLNGEKISLNKDKFAFSFAVCLLRCRFLFDKYIIKREYEDDDSVGSWSLKELKFYGKKKGTNYVNTPMKDYYERDENQFDLRNKRCLMLQAALRVSYTSPKSMHWITELLTWLIRQDYDNGLTQISEIESYIETLIQSAVKENFLNYSDDERFCLGLKTQHIVFNYLDYLLWKEAPTKYKNFVFEFRNSIEHWYPQNPSDRTFDRWEHGDGLDQFGNLCLVPSNINASFSNLDPQVKKIHFRDEVAKGSLKLRKMAEATENPDDRDKASIKWREENCEKHGSEMMKKLRKACGYND